MDEMDAKYAYPGVYKVCIPGVMPIPRAVDNDVRMEDSVPEESDIACHQEVMTGYGNKPIVPTSDGAEPLPSRCAHDAESNETIT